MNKPLLALLLIIGFQTFAQETVHFNMHYKPETKYLCETSYYMELTTINSGSDTFMNFFRENKIDSVSVENQIINGEIELTIMTKDEKGRLPVEMKYISLETNGVEDNLIAGLIAQGTIEGSSSTVFHSFKNSKIDSDFEDELLLMLNQMLEQLEFPNVTMAIGESFEQSMPFKMPIYEFTMETDINITYVLREIENKNAVFDLVYFGDINFFEEGKSFTGSFSGSGYSFYDIKNDILDESKMDMIYELNYFSDYNNLKIVIRSQIQQKFEIQKL